MELPAPADGVLTKIIKQDGGVVTSGEVIATIDTEAKATESAAAPAAESAQAAPQPALRPEPALVEPTPAAAPAEARQDARLMPAARKLVEEHNVDPSRIAGSGRDGRITKADVLDHLAKAPQPAQAEAKDRKSVA